MARERSTLSRLVSRCSRKKEPNEEASGERWDHLPELSSQALPLQNEELLGCLGSATRATMVSTTTDLGI